MGYVTQDVFLLNKPILNNIAFGIEDENIEIKKVNRILKLCHLEKFISSEYYKDKSLGDSNLKISGGEKQRIGIARALYNDPDIIIFDEFTSSLDDTTEEVLIENLNKLKEDKCFILISHKKKPLKYCKEIYNFEENQIKKIFKMFKNKEILITGGTGSFGKKFVDTLLKRHNNFKKLIIFSRDELKQHDMEQELKENTISQTLDSLGDIRDKYRLDRALKNVNIVTCRSFKTSSCGI